MRQRGAAGRAVAEFVSLARETLRRRSNVYIGLIQFSSLAFRCETRKLAILMAPQPCPHCGAVPRHMEDVSKDAMVDYYICPACRHIWHVSKAQPDGPQVAVTVPARAAKAQ